MAEGKIWTIPLQSVDWNDFLLVNEIVWIPSKRLAKWQTLAKVVHIDCSLRIDGTDQLIFRPYCMEPSVNRLNYLLCDLCFAVWIVLIGQVELTESELIFPGCFTRTTQAEAASVILPNRLLRSILIDVEAQEKVRVNRDDAATSASTKTCGVGPVHMYFFLCL